jgi:hypothetical protein
VTRPLALKAAKSDGNSAKSGAFDGAALCVVANKLRRDFAKVEIGESGPMGGLGCLKTRSEPEIVPMGAGRGRVPLAIWLLHCYIGPREAVSRVRSQHIPGALSIL